MRVPGKVRKATAWRLQAPALDATEGVTLAGAEIREGEWSPQETEPVAIERRRCADSDSGEQRGAGVCELKRALRIGRSASIETIKHPVR